MINKKYLQPTFFFDTEFTVIRAFAYGTCPG